jgi:hypothetical protein
MGVRGGMTGPGERTDSAGREVLCVVAAMLRDSLGLAARAAYIFFFLLFLASCVTIEMTL